MYNVFFKRKQIAGFDKDGLPVIMEIVKNGSVIHEDEDLPKTKEPLSYPEPPNSETPFTHDPYNIWSDDFVDPYSYPDIEKWDFPKPEQNIRYRVPGRAHLSNTYPLSQFGYKDDVKGRHRKLLPLPANLPVPKKLPPLMHRKDTDISLEQALKNVYGMKSPRETNGHAIVINPREKLLADESADVVPPLPLRQKSAAPKSARGHSGRPTTASVRSSRSTDVSTDRSSRPISALNGSAITPTSNRLPRAVSAASPRSILTDTLTPRPTTAKPNVAFDVDDRPKPPRIFLPSVTPETPKSALRSDDRPMTGRKSVTIMEDGSLSRPSTTATSIRPLTASERSPFLYKRPMSSAVSARETIVAPHSARPRSERHMLPSELTKAYRPASCGVRPMTPAEHPKPYFHPGVTTVKTSDFSEFNPPPMFNPAPPSEHKMRLVPPPNPFFKKSKSKPEEIASMVTKSGLRITLNTDDSDEDIAAPLFLTGKSKKRSRRFTQENEDKLPFLRVSRPGSHAPGASVFGDGPFFPPSTSRAQVRKNSRSSSIPTVPSILTKNVVMPDVGGASDA